MIIHHCTPTWRQKDNKKLRVELVEEPTAAWLAERRHVRFAIMSDGRLVFGDGMTVLHHDICQAQLTYGRVPSQPFVVGVITRRGTGPWRFANAQEFLHGTSDGAMVNTRRLLAALAVWPSIVTALGNDPGAFPTWGEEGEDT